MGKFWSLLFFLVPILGAGVFVFAPMFGYEMPNDVSEHGYRIDQLYMFILILTGVLFIGTEGVLAWFMWRYDGKTNRDPVIFSHGSHNLEVMWTIIPAGVLLFIAIFQMNTWQQARMDRPDIPPTVEVMGRQFDWRFRYPGADGQLGTLDDVHVVKTLHLPVDEDILIELKSGDVLHSFFLPNLRVKQDAVPGSKIPVWFRATKTGEFDLVCAELCGWGHYKMKGRLIIQSREAFDAWLQQKHEEQEAVQ